MNLLIIGRIVHFAASLLLFGATLFPLYALQDKRRSVIGIGFIRWGSLLALGGCLVCLACTIVNVTGEASGLVDPNLLGIVFTQTAFGPVWIARTLLAIAFTALAFSTSGAQLPRRMSAFAAVGGLGLIMLAGIGHAAGSQGALGWLRLGVQALHLLAAGAWLGALIPLATMLGAAHRTNDTSELAAILTRFSRVGTFAVILILATGLANTLFTTGSPVPNLTSDYGRVLAIKIALFLATVALAIVNRFAITPRLSGAATIETAPTLSLSAEVAPARRFPVGGKSGIVYSLARNVAIELVLMLSIVIAVSILGTMSPAV